MLKKIFIPGWMDTAENRVDYPGLEIWKGKANLEDKIDAEYIIGHSLGANFALINWEKNKNAKLFLINPLLPQRNIFSWLFRWVKFMFTEGTSISKKRLATFPHFIGGTKLCFKLISQDLFDIIDKIPKEYLIIMRGSRDNHFFNKETADFLKSKKVRVIEVEGVGHGWNSKFDDEINKITRELD